MADKMKISWLLKATALSVVLAAAVWFAGLVFNPPGLEMVLAIATIVFSIISICLVVCCIARKINSQISLYKVFAIADIVLAVLAGGYAVYDIRTDTGWTFGRTHNVYGHAGVCGFAVGGLGGMACQPEKKQIISYEGNIKI